MCLVPEAFTLYIFWLKFMPPFSRSVIELSICCTLGYIFRFYYTFRNGSLLRFYQFQLRTSCKLFQVTPLCHSENNWLSCFFCKLMCIFTECNTNNDSIFNTLDYFETGKFLILSNVIFSEVSIYICVFLNCWKYMQS